MRLLIDQDVYALTVAHLRTAGHDVLRVADIGKARAPDIELLAIAARERRVVVTRDLDFGRLIASDLLHSAPVVILRLRPDTLATVHREMLAVLERHSAEELAGAVVVVEPGRHRVRRFSHLSTSESP